MDGLVTRLKYPSAPLRVRPVVWGDLEGFSLVVFSVFILFRTVSLNESMRDFYWG